MLAQVSKIDVESTSYPGRLDLHVVHVNSPYIGFSIPLIENLCKSALKLAYGVLRPFYGLSSWLAYFYLLLLLIITIFFFFFVYKLYVCLFVFH